MKTHLTHLMLALTLFVTAAFAVESDIQFFRDLDMHGKAVKNLAEPAADSDAATKAYVDAATNMSTQLKNMLWVAKNGNDATAMALSASPF
jgi:hypothetical protein